jgi:acetoin utilization deacetylase AcuC-like enzyme
VKVIYTPGHRVHAPVSGFALGRQIAYREAPARIERTLAAVRRAGHEVAAPSTDPLPAVRALHAPDYVDYVAGAYSAWKDAGYSEAGVVADVFPIRRPAHRPAALPRLAGWYLFDSETPIVEGTFEAALGAAACALTGADLLLAGEALAYALCRPPGHHAGRDYGGGYCYFNNAALAARRLADGRPRRRVAILDLDCHHGNGTQDLFYESDAVLYASIHVDPAGAFPYYWGYAEETGEGAGRGHNLNLPLPRGADEGVYTAALDRALEAVGNHGPAFVVVSLGTDAAADDPLSGFALPVEAFGRLGRRIGALGVPVLTVQEGGYQPATMGRCMVAFLAGLDGGNVPRA